MGRKKDKREEFLSLVPLDAKKALDVGCGSGGLGSILRKKGIEVIGIENSEGLHKEASEKLKQVFLADIEKFQMPFSKGYFDCIIYGDVLEHLIEPLAVLKNHKEYLNDNGYVIASVPNVRYYKLITRLVFSGSWDYMDKGILDRSHLRFFALINLKELFIEAGYEITEIRYNIVAARGLRILNLFLFGLLKNFLVYQYYIKAKKSNNSYFSAPEKRKICQF